MNTKERRKHGKEFAYLFFIMEIIIYIEVSHIYLLLFGTSQLSLLLLMLLNLGLFLNSFQRLQRVLHRVAFQEYHFQEKKNTKLHYNL